MSPSQASNDENFDVWKTRVCAALDGKHLLSYVKKADYDGVSEDKIEDSRSDMSDVDVDSKSAKPADVDSNAVDYEESDDELKPPSGSDQDSGDESDTSIKRKDLPEIRPQCESRCQEAKTKAFLMKTMDNSHVRLVKTLNTSYEIFTFISEKYEGEAFRGDPYFIQHYLMEIKYEEGSDLTEFFLKLENEMKAASDATESVMTDVELDVIDSKVNSKTLTLHGVLYAPKLKFSLLSVPAGVKHVFRFNFGRKQCAMQTDQPFNTETPLACDTDLYQFHAKPAVHALAHIATSVKPSVDSMTLRL
ncbi:Hypothetical protein PHPALM_6607 [Phytophthora palmivora]|uniref:Uncharacterized protein n=1 Tax=Phytophthora palmivora TaxID=4796 RepID=A0A2P4YEF0_9STRA|nr:Hypothetical protein PHPALM_6607 [Phytophthora palmivora]